MLYLSAVLRFLYIIDLHFEHLLTLIRVNCRAINKVRSLKGASENTTPNNICMKLNRLKCNKIRGNMNHREIKQNIEEKP